MKILHEFTNKISEELNMLVGKKPQRYQNSEFRIRNSEFFISKSEYQKRRKLQETDPKRDYMPRIYLV